MGNNNSSETVPKVKDFDDLDKQIFSQKHIAQELFEKNSPDAIKHLEEHNMYQYLGETYLFGFCEQKIDLHKALAYFNMVRPPYMFPTRSGYRSVTKRIHIDICRNIRLSLSLKKSALICPQLIYSRNKLFSEAKKAHGNQEFKKALHIFETLVQKDFLMVGKSKSKMCYYITYDHLYYYSLYYSSLYYYFEFENSRNIEFLKKAIYGFNQTKKFIYDSEVKLTSINNYLAEKKIVVSSIYMPSDNSPLGTKDKKYANAYVSQKHMSKYSEYVHMNMDNYEPFLLSPENTGDIKSETS